MRFYEKAELPELHKDQAFCLQCGAPTELRATHGIFRTTRDTSNGRPAFTYEAVCSKAGPQIKAFPFISALRDIHQPQIIHGWIYDD
jgi:hypothetical protein